MPHNTSFNCPYCQRRLQLPEEIRPGTRTRCPHADCRRIFAYSPAEPGAVDEIPIDDGPPVDLMKELIEDEDRPPTVNTKTAARRGDGGLTSQPVPSTPTPAAPPAAPGQPLPRSFRSSKTRQPVAGHPLAQASERSKEVLIGGKAVRFEEPRKYLGAFIGFLILAGGYGCFWGLKAIVDYANNAGEIRAAALKKKFEEGEALKKQKLADALGRAAAKPSPGRKVPAPKQPGLSPPVNTANLDVALVSARIGPFFQGNLQNFLKVTLRITNKSQVAAHKAAWPGPKVTATLRDSVFNLYKVVQLPAQDTTITSGHSIEDSLVFERTVPGAELTLSLTIPDRLGQKPQQIKIRPQDVQQEP